MRLTGCVKLLRKRKNEGADAADRGHEYTGGPYHWNRFDTQKAVCVAAYFQKVSDDILDHVILFPDYSVESDGSRRGLAQADAADRGICGCWTYYCGK